GLGCGITAYAGNNRQPSGRVLYGNFDELDVLFDVNGRRLARRAHHDQSIGALRYMPVDQLSIGVKVETAIGQHRRNEGYQTALESRNRRIRACCHDENDLLELTVNGNLSTHKFTEIGRAHV